MAGSLNKVLLIGRLGADPEIKQMVNGKNVARLSLATSQSWKDKNSGEKQDRTQWHNVSILSEPLVNIAESYLKKGSKVYLEGQLETRKWQDNSGADRYSTEVVLRPYKGQMVLVDSRSDGTNSFNTVSENNAPSSILEDNTTSPSLTDIDIDDEIPF